MAHDDGTFHCLQCPYVCHWQFQLDNHKKKTHFSVHFPPFVCTELNVKPHECELCYFKGNRKVEVYEHFRFVHLRLDQSTRLPLYSCKHCNFTTFSLLFRTQHGNHGSNETRRSFVYNCPECSYHSTLRRQVQAHAVNTCLSLYKCGDCYLRFKRRSMFQRHMRHKHRIVWFHCGECSFVTNAKNRFANHTDLHGDNNKWVFCTRCPYRSREEAKLRRHLLIHAAPIRMILAGNMFRCVKCSYESPQSLPLVKHHRLKHGRVNVAYKCDKCSYVTKSIADLREHEVTCPGMFEMNYVCEKCSFKSIDNIGYRRHLAWHRNTELLSVSGELKCSSGTDKK